MVANFREHDSYLNWVRVSFLYYVDLIVHFVMTLIWYHFTVAWISLAKYFSSKCIICSRLYELLKLSITTLQSLKDLGPWLKTIAM